MATNNTDNELRPNFEQAVLEPIEAQHPKTGAKLDYYNYLQLDPDLRSDDERRFVDNVFTERLLRWLGYEKSDWIYDSRPKDKAADRPDFLLRPNRSKAFVVEDKNTTEEFGSDHADQLRRYTAGLQGYALWTNAREVLALRFYPGGDYETLSRVPVDNRQLDLAGDDETSLALFRTLFEKQRFVEMPGILERICVDEKTWAKEARPLDSPDAQQAFISETKDLLDMLTLAARARIERAEADVSEGREDLRETREKLKEQANNLLDTISSEAKASIEPELLEQISDPYNVDEEEIKALKPDEPGDVSGREWDRRLKVLLRTLADFREREGQRRKSRNIHNSFEVWRDRYRIIEGEEMTEGRRRNAYAEQVAYTFFIRLLLARILEDKGAINRRISDGGLEAWRSFTEPAVVAQNDDEVALHGRALLDVLFQTVSRFYQHFFDQRVFDWFMPDDYLLARALLRLSTFSFENIDRDILGHAYEAYVERAFRSEKGHFLTRGKIVEFILDEADLKGREIIGRRILDPAAGSGSFLVHAARRVRAELKKAIDAAGGTDQEKREKLAEKFIEHIQQDFVGLEINPFSCYLAELNLFLQALDDVLYLWKKEKRLYPVEQFQIFNTDSLVLSDEVLQQQRGLKHAGAELGGDQAREVKLDGEKSFDYVIMNPPYINRGIQHDLQDLTEIPFYNVLFGGGDTNYFHAFIRLANHFVKEGGTVALICPLQLYGDRSAGGIRRWLAAPLPGPAPDGLAAEWRIESLTRFYDRRVLFEGVLQAVCVSVWERNGSGRQDGKVKVAGGWNIEDARHNFTTYDPERVLSADPIANARLQKAKQSGQSNTAPSNGKFTPEWYDSWAVVVEDGYLDAWERLRAGAATDVQQWAQKGGGQRRLVFHQGDVNMTRTKPLRAKSEGGQVEGDLKTPVPTAGSKDTLPFGPYEASGALDAKADVSAMEISDKKKREAERERKDRVLRLTNLEGTEAVCMLKEISGIEPARPIQGALYHRGGGEELICFEHTTQIVFARKVDDAPLTEALFGLLVSSAANFIFSLFSTNQHVGTYEIQRLLIPDLGQSEIRDLADLSREVQTAGEAHWRTKTTFGCGPSIMAIDPDPWEVLMSSRVEKEPLETALLRGHLTQEGPDWHVSTLWEKDYIQVVQAAAQPKYEDALELLLPSVDERFEECKKDVELPTPDAAEKFVEDMELARQKLEKKRGELFQTLANLDRYVLSLYGITDLPTCRLIGGGMPWASTQKQWVSEIVQRLDNAPVPTAPTSS